MNEIAYGVGEPTDEKVVFSFSTEGMHKPITNGDVIKALFPKAEIHDWYAEDDYIDIYGVDYEALTVCRKWWNAPYKREDAPKCDTCIHKSKGFEFCDGCVDNDLFVIERDDKNDGFNK